MRGQLLELVQELPALGAVPPRAHVLHPHDHAQRDAVLVRVEEGAAHHAPGALAHEELRGALAGVEVPAVLDHAGRQLDDLLVAERVMPGLGLRRETGLGAEQPQHALRDDDDLRADLVLAGADADDAAVLAQQLVDLHVGHDHGALLGDLVGQVLVELGAHHRVALRLLGREPLRGDLDGRLAPAGHHRDQLAGDGPLERRFFPELRIEAPDRLHVQAPARDVLGAGVVPALEDHDLHAGLGQAVGRGEAGEAATDDDALYCLHVTSPGCCGPRRAPRPREAEASGRAPSGDPARGASS